MARIIEKVVEVDGTPVHLRYDFNAAADFREQTGLEIWDDALWPGDDETGRKQLSLTPSQQRALIWAMNAAHYKAQGAKPEHSIEKIGSLLAPSTQGEFGLALVALLLGDPAAVEKQEGGAGNPPPAPEGTGQPNG
ncbi:MAG: hypothetical protein AMXMBFR53_29920 [Gemmatimonadota bacterium]